MISLIRALLKYPADKILLVLQKCPGLNPALVHGGGEGQYQKYRLLKQDDRVLLC